MCRVGIIVAVEFDIFRKIYNVKEIEKGGCYKIFQIKDEKRHLIFLASGPGEIQGGAATQYMIDMYQPDFLINLGLVGGLSESMKVGDICLVDGVVHTDYNVSSYESCHNDKNNINDIKSGIKPGQYIGLSSEKIRMDRRLGQIFYMELGKIVEYDEVSIVSCASQDRIIMGDDNRKALERKWNCQICDMELAGIGLVALKNKIPLVSLKIVSDTIGDDCDMMDNWEDKFYDKFKILSALLIVCENLDKY